MPKQAGFGKLAFGAEARFKKAADCKSCPAGAAVVSKKYGAKHVAAFIQLSRDAGSISIKVDFRSNPE